MKWPLVWRSRFDKLQAEYDFLQAQQLLMIDREAFNVVVDERDRLREQVDKLLDHERRMERVEHGLTEKERQERDPIGVMPRDMREYMKKWPPQTRNHQIRLARKQRAEGKRWDEIWAEIQEKRNARGAERPSE